MLSTSPFVLMRLSQKRIITLYAHTILDLPVNCGAAKKNLNRNRVVARCKEGPKMIGNIMHNIWQVKVFK